MARRSIFRLPAKKAKDPLPRTVEDAEQEPGYLPGNYHVGALRERRLLISLRAVAIGMLASICLNMIMGLVIFTLVPLKEVQPFLVRVMDEGTVVADVRPIQNTFEAQDLLTEKLVRDYVTIRHEILRSDDVMKQRWSGNGQMAMMSEATEYSRFVANVSPLLEEIRRLNNQTLVSIMSVVPITVGRSYVVDFRQTTYDEQDNVTEDKVYTSTMEIEYRPMTGMTRDQLLINPTGFTVVAYSIAEKTQ